MLEHLFENHHHVQNGLGREFFGQEGHHELPYVRQRDRVELQPLEERHHVQPKAAAAALGRGLLHPAKANLNGHVVHVPLCGELLHRDRLPVEAKLPVAALPHALGQDLLGLVEIRADGFPTASARRVVIADRVLLSPFPDGPQLSASFLAEAMPVPSDRSGLHGESR